MDLLLRVRPTSAVTELNPPLPPPLLARMAGIDGNGAFCAGRRQLVRMEVARLRGEARTTETPAATMLEAMGGTCRDALRRLRTG